MKAVCLIFAALLLGCDAESDMGQQPKYKPLSPSPLFTDGKSSRPLVAGVVPRDAATVPGNAYGAVAAASATPIGTAVVERMSNPSEITETLVALGQQKFDIFCAACHGRLGNGLGMIAQRGLMHPPSFHIERLKRSGDGHFFDVMTSGYGAMYSYADKLSVQERWAVVAYVRALQLAGDGATPDLAATLYGAGDAKAKTAGYRQ